MPTRTEETLLDTLLEIERSGWDALCEGSAADFYGRVMLDDAVMVLGNGQVMTRGDVVRALGDARAWSSYEIDDAHAFPIGDGAAAVVYRGTGYRDGADPFVGAMASVYVDTGDDWKLALYQQTPVAGD
jgi:hypothetical protein